MNNLSMPVVPATPMEMLNRALMSGAAPETLEKLLVLQERWEKSQGRRAFEQAVVKAKAKLPGIVKNRSVSFGTGRTSYQYEDLGEIERTVVPVLSEFGLSYRFRTDTISKPGAIIITCIVAHEAGYYEENSLSGPADMSGSKNEIQAIGSTVTYLQRYTLKAALGLAASKDDDALGADKAEVTAARRKDADYGRLMVSDPMARETYDKVVKAFEGAKTEEELKKNGTDLKADIRRLPNGWVDGSNLPLEWEHGRLGIEHVYRACLEALRNPTMQAFQESAWLGSLERDYATCEDMSDLFAVDVALFNDHVNNVSQEARNEAHRIRQTRLDQLTVVMEEK